jgi:hypothetical protein
MDILAQLRETIATAKSAMADGKITGDEAMDIAREVLELALLLLGKKTEKPQ